MTAQQTIPDQKCCVILVHNDVLGTRDEKLAPMSAVEALEVDGDLERAQDFIAFQRDRLPIAADQEPIGCCIQHTGRVIRLTWFAVTNDMEAARNRMEAVLHDPNWWRVVL